MNHLKQFDYKQYVDLKSSNDQWNMMWDDFYIIYSRVSMSWYSDDGAQLLTSMRQNEDLMEYSLGNILAIDVPDGVQWISDTSLAYGEADDKTLEVNPIGWDGEEIELTEG